MKPRFPWLQTSGNRAFDLLNPKPEQIDIEEIAMSLSRISRYVGHYDKKILLYTVAEHSVYVSRECAPIDALAGLVHDAAEAYLADVPSPVKKTLRYLEKKYHGRTDGKSSYDDLEDRVARAIATRFGAEYPWPVSVHVADMTVLAAEMRDLKGKSPRERDAMPSPMVREVACWPPRKAMKKFLERFEEVNTKRKRKEGVS